MTKIVQAKDYTHLFVDQKVINMMSEECVKGDVLDFSGINVMDSDLGTLAEIILDKGLEIRGLDNDSILILDSHVRKLSVPIYENLKEFKEMFKAKFPKGTLCIWDKMLDKHLNANENRLSLVMVEDVYENFVRFRLYKSHLVEPKYVSQYGGINARELYTIESVHITDFANKSIMFRYPKDENEEIIIDLLLNISTGN